MTNENIIAGKSNYNFAAKWLPNGVVFSRGAQSKLWDTEGNEWLDFYCNFGANIIGHGNSQYISYISQGLMNQSSVVMSELAIKAAQKVNSYVPSMEKMRFAMTGTEVVQTAFRLSRAYTGRLKILRFTGHYHGHTDNILGGTYDGVHDYPVIVDGDARASLGTISTERINETLIAPWNNVEIFNSIVERNHDSIACMIMEPLNMNGGALSISDKFLSAVLHSCSRYGILLIFDEIITLNRTNIGGIQKVLGVTPDLTLLGKTLAGGALPVSAIGGRKEILSLLEDFKVVQAGTFNGYHAGMAAVLATYRLLENGGLERMMQRGRFIRECIETISKEERFPVITQGADGCFCIHPSNQNLLYPSDWTQKMRDVESRMQQKFFNHRVCVAPLLRFYLNIDITDEEIEKLLSVCRTVFKEMAKEQL